MKLRDLHKPGSIQSPLAEHQDDSLFTPVEHQEVKSVAQVIPIKTASPNLRVEQFITEQCERLTFATGTHAELYLAWKEWGGTGDGDAFGEALERLGYDFDTSTLEWSGLCRAGKCFAMTPAQFAEKYGHPAPPWPKPEEQCQDCGFCNVDCARVCGNCGARE